MKNYKTILANAKRHVQKALSALGPAVPVREIKSLRELRSAIRGVRVEADLGGIPGWLTDDEQSALYALGILARPPILEVGAWLGRSTVCIAAGIIASGVQKEFITSELGPTLANFRPLPDGRMAFYYPPESETSMGACPMELFERDIKPIVSHPAGVVGQLRENLRQRGMESLVRVVVGDFRRELPQRQFGLIFADTMHEPSEIRRNAPDLRRYLSSGAILACHDTTRQNRKEIKRHFLFTESLQIDSLFIGVVRL